MADFATLWDWFLLGAAILVVVLAPVAVFVSLRRNQREIESFAYPDLSQFRMGVQAHQSVWLKKKMRKMGWRTLSEEPDPKFGNTLQIRFEKEQDDARPLKDVLISLNRSLILPIGPLNLHREEAQTNAQTH